MFTWTAIKQTSSEKLNKLFYFGLGWIIQQAEQALAGSRDFVGPEIFKNFIDFEKITNFSKFYIF